MDPYGILKVRSDVSNDELKRKKKELLVRFHPDKVDDIHIKQMCEEHCTMLTKADEDVMNLRKHKSLHTNRTKGDHYDILYSMYSKSELSHLVDESFIDMPLETGKVFEELEEQMRKINRD